MRKKDIATDIGNFISKHYTDPQSVSWSSDLDSQFRILSLDEFKVDESSLEEVPSKMWNFSGSCMAVIIDQPKTTSKEVPCRISGTAEVDAYKNLYPIPESGDDMLPETRYVDMNIHVDLHFLDTPKQ